MAKEAGEGQRSATKGLATVALLKVNFDAGRDHIGMFEPFILDAASGFAADGFVVEDLQKRLIERSQLSIPANTLRTLIHRSVKRGFVRREGGRYFLTEKPIEVGDLVSGRRSVEERQRRLADSLCEFARERRLALATTEDALSAILAFLEEHHVSLALDERPKTIGLADEDGKDASRRTAVVAAFLQKELASEGEGVRIVQEMLEGFVLQNALLLKDISTASRRFTNLEVFLDTGVLLGALGFRGEATEIATKEALSLLRESGARLSVFEPTIREIRSILSVYEEKLATSEGRLSLHPTDVTRFFLTKHYSPSEVRTQSALVQRNLIAMGLNVRDLPKHRQEYTLDEVNLAKRLADRVGGERDPRVLHDVDCIAGVLTLRGGRTCESFDDARAVFATASAMTVENSRDWYQGQGGRGVPPIIHHLNLSNLAWLKRPASASRLKLHELVALCAAALRPSRNTWNAFLKHLKKLQETGELSSDEVTAIVASELTDRVLADAVDDEVDATTLSEVVERVKAGYREKADAEVAAAREEAQSSEKRALAVRMNVERRARGLAWLACWVVTGALAAVFFAGLVATVISMRSGKTPGLMGSALASALGIAGFLSVLLGFNLKGWRQSREERLTQRLKGWLAGDGV